MKMSIAFLGLILLSACSSEPKEKSGAASEEQAASAMATVSSVDKKVNGQINFKETDKGILVTADVHGLPPQSVHGFHVHEKGKCDPPGFTSAGGHFNPQKTSHGGPAAPERHAGDFGNLVSDKSERARTQILLKKNEVKDLQMFMGKAVIVHAKPDDLVTQPTGNAGDRLACGILKAE